MTRNDAEKIITEYLKPIFGFALKRCRSEADAEDLTQDIVLRAFRALLQKNDISDTGKFIWTVAHNTLANYYREGGHAIIGVSVDDMAEILADNSLEDEDNSESIARLQKEIAYLSKERRQIVIAYYFENKKQAEIAAKLGIPVGTVKWHLFEAKKELKKGMDKMRKSSELKFRPIQFGRIGINGTTPSKTSPNELFRTTLSQNICFAIRDTVKTVNEIADDLGVSPAYVEPELEYLADYGLVNAEKGGYIANFIIDIPSAELITLQSSMYKRAAEIFSNDLYDELTASGILDDPHIVCRQTDAPLTMTSAEKADRNFLMWSLIPFIAARSNRNINTTIKFSEVATIRPDGSQNIINTSVVKDPSILPAEYRNTRNLCGPMWNKQENCTLWQVDSEWSDRPTFKERNCAEEAKKVISLYTLENETGILSKLDYAWLAEKGYIKVCGDPDGFFKSSWQIVTLYGEEIENRLCAIGDAIKEKYKAEFEALKAPYIKANLDSVPKHLRRIREYDLQFLFHSDGWFLLNCIICLLENGKLKPPTEEQRKVLTTVLCVSE